MGSLTKLFVRAWLLVVLPLSIFAQDKKIDKTATAKALAFVSALNEQQKAKVVFPFQEMNRYDWHYVPASMIARTGLPLKDMDSV